jgi:Las1-like protein
MVQYILTPWRHRRELLEVRKQFYPEEGQDVSGGEAARSRERHRAVARVSVWMQRGACPHLVESTALLTAAILSDAASASASAAASISGGGGSAGTYAARAAYAAAFSR